MPNISHEITFGGKPCVIANTQRYPEAKGKANGYWCPLGFEPGRAYVLMCDAHVREIIDAAESFTLEVTTKRAPSGDIIRADAFLQLYIVQAIRLGPGQSYGNSVRLVELIDRRALGRFTEKTTILANLHSAAHPGLVDGQLVNKWIDGTDAQVGPPGNKTWQEVINEAWPDIFGAAPMLPPGITSIPNDLQFHGANAWTEILPEVLSRLSCTVRYDPTMDMFSIVRLGEAAQGLPGGLPPAPIYDADVLTPNRVNLPRDLAFYYFNHSPGHGSEIDTDPVSNWITNPPYTREEINTGARGVAGTVLPVWMDTRHEADEDGNDLNMANRVDARMETYNRILFDQEIDRRHVQYQGVHTSILPSSRIKAVSWHDYGQGWVTEWVEHPGKASKPRKTTSVHMPEVHETENFTGPNFEEKGYPTWPKTQQLVKILDSGTMSDPLDGNPNSSMLHKANVYRWVNNAPVEGEDSWVRVVTNHDVDGGNAMLTVGTYLLGRLAGTANHMVEGDDIRLPLYLVDPEETMESSAVVTASRGIANPNGSMNQADWQSARIANCNVYKGTYSLNLPQGAPNDPPAGTDPQDCFFFSPNAVPQAYMVGLEQFVAKQISSVFQCGGETLPLFMVQGTAHPQVALVTIDPLASPTAAVPDLTIIDNENIPFLSAGAVSTMIFDQVAQVWKQHHHSCSIIFINEFSDYVGGTSVIHEVLRKETYIGTRIQYHHPSGKPIYAVRMNEAHNGVFIAELTEDISEGGTGTVNLLDEDDATISAVEANNLVGGDLEYDSEDALKLFVVKLASRAHVYYIISTNISCLAIQKIFGADELVDGAEAVPLFKNPSGSGGIECDHEVIQPCPEEAPAPIMEMGMIESDDCRKHHHYHHNAKPRLVTRNPSSPTIMSQFTF